MTPELQQKIIAAAIGIFGSVLAWLVREWTKSVLTTLEAAKGLPTRVLTLESENLARKMEIATAREESRAALTTANACLGEAHENALKVARMEGEMNAADRSGAHRQP